MRCSGVPGASAPVRESRRTSLGARNPGPSDAGAQGQGSCGNSGVPGFGDMRTSLGPWNPGIPQGRCSGVPDFRDSGVPGLGDTRTSRARYSGVPSGTVLRSSRARYSGVPSGTVLRSSRARCSGVPSGFVRRTRTPDSYAGLVRRTRTPDSYAGLVRRTRTPDSYAGLVRRISRVPRYSGVPGFRVSGTSRVPRCSGVPMDFTSPSVLRSSRRSMPMGYSGVPGRGTPEFPALDAQGRGFCGNSGIRRPRRFHVSHWAPVDGVPEFPGDFTSPTGTSPELHRTRGDFRRKVDMLTCKYIDF